MQSRKDSTKAEPASSYTLLSDANDLTPNSAEQTPLLLHAATSIKRKPKRRRTIRASKKQARVLSTMYHFSQLSKSRAASQKRETKSKHTHKVLSSLPALYFAWKQSSCCETKTPAPPFLCPHSSPETPFQPFLYTRKYLCMTPRNPKINSYSLVESQSPLLPVCVPSAP